MHPRQHPWRELDLDLGGAFVIINFSDVKQIVGCDCFDSILVHSRGYCYSCQVGGGVVYGDTGFGSSCCYVDCSYLDISVGFLYCVGTWVDLDVDDVVYGDIEVWDCWNSLFLFESYLLVCVVYDGDG